jgi:hypothetical protein
MGSPEYPTFPGVFVSEMCPGDSGVILDGEFSVEDLEKIIAYLRPPRDVNRPYIDAQDVAELTAKIKADPEVGARLMREAGIWDENNKLTPLFGGTTT